MDTLINAMPLTLSLNAVDKAYELLTREGRTDLALRISVAPGGCSGLRYQLYFDDQNHEDDVKHIFGGTGEAKLPVVVDKMSNPYLLGAEVDFVDTIDKQGFTIDNPNAGGSCACGGSFS